MLTDVYTDFNKLEKLQRMASTCSSIFLLYVGQYCVPETSISDVYTSVGMCGLCRNNFENKRRVKNNARIIGENTRTLPFCF